MNSLRSYKSCSIIDPWAIEFFELVPKNTKEAPVLFHKSLRNFPFQWKQVTL